MTRMINALAAPNQPQAVFEALEADVQDTIGVKLLTLMTIHRDRNVARRCYSNMPDAYPTSGEKEMQPNAWSQHVEEQHQTFVANTIDEIAAVFPDHELIQSLGCESCINIPVVIKGHVIGTLNCLHEAGYYTPERVQASETLKTAGALAFLVAQMENQP